MPSLPIVDQKRPKRPGQFQTRTLHFYRVGLFLLIVAAIHHQHRWYVAQQRGGNVEPIRLEQVTTLFPKADALGEYALEHGGQMVLDSAGKSIGFVIQTFPDAENVIGFSGPTNTMIGFGSDNRIVGMTVIHSGDTREHLGDVLRNSRFMTSLNGLTWKAAGLTTVDAVSGATLTSLSIVDGVKLRMGGENPSSRFPEELSVEEIRPHFASAARLEPDREKPSLRRVVSEQGELLGYVTRTSPHADSMIGYQGPTDVTLITDPDKLVMAIAIRNSFDNEPFVQYVKDDEYFLNTFVGFTLDDLTELDVVDAGIDGVSGATKTSVTVAEALIHTAKEIQREEALPEPDEERFISLSARDYGTATVVLFALLIAFTHLRGKRKLRVAFQVVLVVYLGFMNADMVSQAMLVGWAQNGVAWRNAPALVFLTVAALLCPVLSGRQVYCTHVCPFGAMQETLKRVPLKAKLSRRMGKLARAIPALLLVLVVAVAMWHLRLRLVGIEPFDAFVFRIAGVATITVAVVGLLASMWIPMAYCHYGCPTGAMLRFLRYHGASGRWNQSDTFATGLALFAVAVWLL